MNYFLFSLLKIVICSLTMFFCFTSYASSQTKPKICMILDKGGKDDHSFNESAVKGFEQALKTLPISPESKFVEPHTDAQISQFFNSFSTAANCDLIVAIGFTPAAYVPAIASQFPQKKYLVIDSNLERKDKNKNILSITFEEHEGSFLVGAIAALKSKTGKIGFVGGMDVPLIHRFELGYVSGAKHINPNIKVVSTYVGVTPDAWNNPAKAKELAISQYRDNVDIIFQVAAGSGQGVFDAAEEFNKSNSKTNHYAIGVDSNQNWVNPAVILTSMEKRVNVGLYNTIRSLTENKFSNGHIVLGLKEEGVLWSLDKYNQKYFSKNEINKINDIKQQIMNNKIIVPDYYKIK